ncbi:hypothetical protein H4S01_001519, partial [Coemansia sp. RSA 2610]
VCRKRRSRCDGQKPKCTSCVRRGLECEYRAMRKRGRHGKRSLDNAEGRSPAQSSAQGGENAAAMVAAAAAAWSLTSPPLQPAAGGPMPTPADSAAFSLLDSLPRFFSLPPEVLPSSQPQSQQQQQQPQQQQQRTADHPMISAIAQPLPAARLPHSMSAIASTMGSQNLLAAVLSPPAATVPDPIQAAFLSSIDTQQQQQRQQHQQPYLPHQQAPPAHYRSRQASSFLSSPSPNATFSHPQPPMAFRSMSASSNGHVFDTSVGAMSSSLSGIASPIGLGSVLGSPTLNMFSPPQPPPGRQQPAAMTDAAAAAAAAAAAVAAFQFSPASSTHVLPAAAAISTTMPLVSPPPPAPATHPARTSAGAALSHAPAIGVPATGMPAIGSPPRRRRKSAGHTPAQQQPGQPQPAQQHGARRRGDWSRAAREDHVLDGLCEEDQVLDGLREDGADDFGRPLFDVSTYPLPARAELDEHMNGMFEYFYMGVQTLHGPTFRQRVARGDVSPVLIYAIMAVASRYSRRPSLHSLNGKAFLNGDRHAATACGLASILLNHGDLGTVDTIHAMLFLSVYFMGQGNMLKSRMYLVKAVCTARTMGFQNTDATFVPSNPMVAFSGAYDRRASPALCACARAPADVVALETKRRIWWFLVFVDYFTANVMNVPLEIPPDSYCVRLPCSDAEWASATLSNHASPAPGSPRDLGFGDRLASAQQGAEYLRLNGFHDCRPPWLYQPGAFYLERLMIEFCDHLRRLNSLRALAIRSFFHVEPAFVDENYPYLKRRRQFVPWPERLEKVKSAWSWLHLQLNKWLDSILLRFSEVVNRVPSDRYNRQYRHQYYYYLLAAHSTIIMSHGVILQLHADFARYLGMQQPEPHADAPHAHTPHLAHPDAQPWPPAPFDAARPGLALSEGLSEFALGTLGSAMAPLISYAQNMASGSSAAGSSRYGSVIGSPVSANHSAPSAGSRSQSSAHPYTDEPSHDADDRSYAHTPMPSSSAAHIQRDLADMAVIAWDGCVSTAEQLASILRGKHPKFVLLGGSPVDVFHEQVLSGDANILSAPGSAFNAPGTGPGADNPILSDPDFYMRLQPSTAWWMFLVAQVQVGHIKRLLKESEGSFKVSARRKAYQAKMAAAKAPGAGNFDPSPQFASHPDTASALDPDDSAAMQVDQAADIIDIPHRLQKASDHMRPLSTSVNNSAVMLATAVHLSNSAPLPPSKHAMEKRADIKTRAARLVRAYENLSCMVKVLEGMQQYWQCMDYVSVIQDILKGSEHPLH